jgi:hypothetical protein
MQLLEDLLCRTTLHGQRRALGLGLNVRFELNQIKNSHKFFAGLAREIEGVMERSADYFDQFGQVVLRNRFFQAFQSAERAYPDWLGHARLRLRQQDFRCSGIFRRR